MYPQAVWESHLQSNMLYLQSIIIHIQIMYCQTQAFAGMKLEITEKRNVKGYWMFV